MSLLLSEVAPDAWREMEVKGEPAARAEQREPQPIPGHTWPPRDVGAGPGRAAARLQAKSGTGPKLDWASGQRTGPLEASPPRSGTVRSGQVRRPPRQRAPGTPRRLPGGAPQPRLGKAGDAGGLAAPDLPAGAHAAQAARAQAWLLAQRYRRKPRRAIHPHGEPGQGRGRFVQGHFTTNDSYGFSNSRKSTGVNFVSTLVVSGSASLLQQEILEEISTLDTVVQDLYVAKEKGTQIGYDGVCAKYQGACVPSTPLLSAWRMHKDLDPTNITFPLFDLSGQPIYLAGTIGGTFLGKRTGRNQLLVKAKAMWLLYYLKTENVKDNELSKMWLMHS